MSFLQRSKSLLLEKRKDSAPVICEKCGFEMEVSRKDAGANQHFAKLCSCGHQTEFLVESGLDPREQRSRQMVYQMKKNASRQLVRTY